jgi:hypothetical protein
MAVCNHKRIVHHEGVADRQNDVVRHALDLRAFDGDSPVIWAGTIDEKTGFSERSPAITPRSKSTGGSLATMPRVPRETRRSGERLEEGEVAETVDDLRALVRRGHHDDAAKVPRMALGKPGPQENASHGMGDEVHRVWPQAAYASETKLMSPPMSNFWEG